MATVGRLKNDNLLLSGEILERMPTITSGLVAHYPLDGTTQRADVPTDIRYIRDWVDGSTANPGDHWVEIQAIDNKGTNVALNKTVTTNSSIAPSGQNLNRIVDGSIDTTVYSGLDSTFPVWVQIDLGQLYSIFQIKVWHYYGDTRTYHGTKTEVSVDGVTWYPIFNSTIEGEYAESATGKIHTLGNLGKTVKASLESNLSVTPEDGIGFGEATVNYAVNPSFATTNNWSYTTNGTSTFTTDGRWGKMNISSGDVGHYHYPQQTIYRVVPANTPITYSVTFRNNTVGKFSLRLVMFVGATAPQQPMIQVDLDGSGIPKRYSVTGTHTVDSDSQRIDILAGSYYTSFGGLTDGSVEFTDAQLEQKGYPTAFVNGSRAGAGYIEINNLSAQTFSLAFQFRPSVEYYKVLTAAYGRIMLDMFDTDGVRHIAYTDYVATPAAGNTVSSPYLHLDPDPSWDNIQHHWHHSYGYTANQWHDFVITKTGSVMRIYVALNGTVLINTTFTYADSTKLNDFVLTKLRIGYTDNTVWNGQMRNLSIYNREILPGELSKVATPKFAITQDGNLVSQLQEDMSAWIPVYQGPATLLRSGGGANSLISLDIFDPNIQFNQVRITSPFWSLEKVVNTTATCKLQQSMRDYMQWSFNQPDANSPLIKFHGLDGIQSVGTVETGTATIMYGYSNSYRVVAYPIYITTSATGNFTGQARQGGYGINTPEWDTHYGATTDYGNYFLQDDFQESGKFALTPLRYQTITIWVRMKPTSDQTKMKSKQNRILLQGQIVEKQSL